MKRYDITSYMSKTKGIDVHESETGEWVKWEDAKWYTPQFKLIDYPEITQAEHESLHEGN